MERTPYESSLIKSAGHDPAANEMHVEYPNGSVYAYANVDAAKHAEFVASESKGKWLIANLRGNPAHPFKQIVPPAKAAAKK